MNVNLFSVVICSAFRSSRGRVNFVHYPAILLPHKAHPAIIPEDHEQDLEATDFILGQDKGAIQ
jgi:hypothetical protein